MCVMSLVLCRCKVVGYRPFSMSTTSGVLIFMGVSVAILSILFP